MESLTGDSLTESLTNILQDKYFIKFKEKIEEIKESEDKANKLKTINEGPFKWSLVFTKKIFSYLISLKVIEHYENPPDININTSKFLEGNGLNEEVIDDYAQVFVDYFGYNNYCLDNRLDNYDRDIFYDLEDLNLLKQNRKEKLQLAEGKTWTICSWEPNYKKITELVNNSVAKKDIDPTRKMYGNLDDNVWNRELK
ncbi:hypothetical protein GF374_00295 [Candidatus Woesearchaeota archaeon]|nr:hypothetical protein [Candidatus Woesearchaeota archaeon]